MHAKDLMMLACLRKNSREKLKKIAAKIKLAPSTAYDKLKHHKKNTISRFTAILDFSLIGYLVMADVFVKVNNKEKILPFLRENSNINNLYRVSNGWDYKIEVLFKNMKDLEDFLDELKEKGVQKKEVIYIVEELKKEAFLSDPDKLIAGEKNL